MSTILLRAYLLLGLVLHKSVWEVMKRRQPAAAGSDTPPPAPAVRLQRLAKLAILIGITLQIVIPDRWVSALLITDQPMLLRWVGLAIYTTGLLIAVSGRLQLGDNWTDIETPGVQSEQRVVSRGVYRLIRHPIYVGDLLLLVGLELALDSWLVLGALALIPFVLRRAVREEKMLIEKLPGYGDYCRRTKRFLPFLV